MKKELIAVLMGGPSHEHDVSIKTSEAILKSLDKEKYNSVKVFIDKNNLWSIDGRLLCSPSQTVTKLKELKVDVVFIGLHGTYGEDGRIQELLEENRLSYTGSGVESSKRSMDKHQSNEAYIKAGLKVPSTLVFKSSEIDKQQTTITNNFNYPLIIKPVSQGSSFGVNLVNKQEEVLPALRDAAQYDQNIMVQEFIAGREVSCGVLEDKEGVIKSLPPTELIVKNSKFFDFSAKYTPNATQEITPPDMPMEIIEKIQETAVAAHKALGCSTYSRTDIIVDEDGKLFVIETNTLPGMTETSILPQQAFAAGMSFSELVDFIIENRKAWFNG